MTCTRKLPSGCRLPDPNGQTSLRKHHIFDTRAREVPFYATCWVQPVVHPMAPCGDFSGSSWVRAVDVFDCMPDTLFRKYLMIVLGHTNQYQPHISNSELPKELRQFTECDECGRKPWEDCMAMGSQVGTDGDRHLACVYCSTYRAVEDFLQSDTKWFDMLLLGGQVRICLFVCADTCSMAAVSCAQAEARIQRDRLYVTFGTGDGVSEGNHERKHQSDTDMVEQCHHKFRFAHYLLWYL